jgi:hypothetical protein
MAILNIKRAEFHGEWNYTTSPNNLSGRLRAYFVTGPKHLRHDWQSAATAVLLLATLTRGFDGSLTRNG